MPDDKVRVRLDSLGDHDLLVEHGVLLINLATSLSSLVTAQLECNRACQSRLREIESRIGKYDKLEGWMKGLWLITGGIVVATIAVLWKTKGG